MTWMQYDELGGRLSARTLNSPNPSSSSCSSSKLVGLWSFCSIEVTVVAKSWSWWHLNSVELFNPSSDILFAKSVSQKIEIKLPLYTPKDQYHFFGNSTHEKLWNLQIKTNNEMKIEELLILGKQSNLLSFFYISTRSINNIWTAVVWHEPRITNLVKWKNHGLGRSPGSHNSSMYDECQSQSA